MRWIAAKGVSAGALAGAALLLAACKTTVSTDVFWSDVYKVVAEKAALPLSVELGLEVPSEAECREMEANMSLAMSKAWSTAQFIGCESLGFTSFARFRVGSEMVYEEINKKADGKYPIYIGVYREDGRIHISYFMNVESMKALQNSIPKEIASRQSGNQELILAAVINNDGEGPISVGVSNAFVDGKPIPDARAIEISKRMKVTVRLSDVSNAAVARGGYALIASAPTE